MSTITTILGTDAIADSRAVINTNFSNLNTDKQEILAEGAFVDGDKTKLDGIATGATANSSDATLLARANHTGTQTASTISDFNSAALTAAPAETTTTTGTLISGATSKATPIDADTLGLSDSAASNVLKSLTWANVKATLKTYFDTLYQATGSYITNGGPLGTPSSGTLTNCTGLPVAGGGTGASTATAAFDNLAPTTTQGDMIYNNGTDNVRLPKGTASQVLTMNAGATAPEWVTQAGGGGSSDFLRAYVSSTQTISASTNTVVDYDTETYDTGGNFNTTTNTYTCPSAGKYYVYAVAQISNTFANSTRYDLEVQKNSTTIAEIFYQTSGTGGVLKKSMQISSIVDCALNDTLRINANFGSGNDIEAGSGLSWLEIYKIA